MFVEPANTFVGGERLVWEVTAFIYFTGASLQLILLWKCPNRLIFPPDIEPKMLQFLYRSFRTGHLFLPFLMIGKQTLNAWFLSSFITSIILGCSLLLNRLLERLWVSRQRNYLFMLFLYTKLIVFFVYVAFKLNSSFLWSFCKLIFSCSSF